MKSTARHGDSSTKKHRAGTPVVRVKSRRVFNVITKNVFILGMGGVGKGLFKLIQKRQK